MTSPSAPPTIEQPADDDVAVEVLDAMFRLPSFVTPRDDDAASGAPAAAPEPTTISENVALALFACLAVCSVVLVVVSFVD